MAPTRQVVSCSRVLFNSISSASRPKTPTRSNITTKQPCLASSFHTSSTVNRAQRTLDSQTISEITQKESEITHQSEPVKGGPTAQAQKHANEAISNPNVVSDIVKGETNITQNDAPIAGGPAAKVMSEAAQAGNECIIATNHQTRATRSALRGGETHTGTLDAGTISRITRAETELPGRAEPARGGPAAQAQRHAGEPIGSENLHDITAGEKKVTGGERVRGGPTATAQSELAKSRS